MFPDSQVLFTLVANDKRGQVKLDKQHRIWLSRITFDIYMQANGKLEIVKNNDGTYTLNQPQPL